LTCTAGAGLEARAQQLHRELERGDKGGAISKTRGRLRADGSCESATGSSSIRVRHRFGRFPSDSRGEGGRRRPQPGQNLYLRYCVLVVVTCPMNEFSFGTPSSPVNVVSRPSGRRPLDECRGVVVVRGFTVDGLYALNFAHPAVRPEGWAQRVIASDSPRYSPQPAGPFVGMASISMAPWEQ